MDATNPCPKSVHQSLMIEYLLDTNTCIALINGTNRNVAAKRESIQDGQVAVPSVVAFELAYGVAKST